MKSKFSIGLLLSVMIVLWITRSGYAQTAIQISPQNLFIPSTYQSRASEHFSPEVIRWRSVEVDFNLLHEAARSVNRLQDGGQPSFVFNLFEDAAYPATIETSQELANGSFGMTGSIDSLEVNEFVLVSRVGSMQAYLQVGSRYFEVRSDGAGHLIVEVNPELYPESLTPESFDPNSGQQDVPTDLSLGLLPEADPAGQIDVLAVYTPAARAAVGGTAAMETRIQASILSSNQGYTASGVSQQVRLVGMEEVSYTETVPGVTDPLEVWSYALYRLTFGRYGTDPAEANYLADARAFRDSYGADLVFMVTALPNDFCGYGWLGGNSSQDYLGYSVVRYNCTGSTSYTVQHEMGHNMGACHDRGNNTSSGCYDLAYSYGYQQPNQFYTVMAYSSGCGTCTRLNRWSNPNLTYNGFPTGVPLDQPDSAYNTLTLNTTAANVANYRQSVSPISASFVSPSPGGASLIPRTNLDIIASSSVGSIVRVTYSAHYDGSWNLVFNDTNSSDGWDYLWPTYNLSEQMIDLQAEIEDSLGNLEVIQLPDIKLSRSHSIGGIYSSRQESAEAEEVTASADLQQAQPGQEALNPELVPAQVLVVRAAAYNTLKMFLLR